MIVFVTVLPSHLKDRNTGGVLMTKDRLRLLERLVRGEKKELEKPDPNNYSGVMEEDDKEKNKMVIETETAKGEV